MNQSALTKFFRILGIRTVWLKISLSNLKFRASQKDILISKAFGDMLNQSWFFEQHNFNTEQAATDEADRLENNPDIQKVDDLQQDDFSEALREDLQEGTDGLYTDESSVNHFDLIANLLLELREKCSLRTSASCFISEKLGHIIEQDRNKFANKILSVMHKYEKFIQSRELRITVYMVSPFLKACQKFTSQKSLSTYMKAKKVFGGTKGPASLF